MRLLADPLDESTHVGVGRQGFERVVLPFEILVVEDGVYVPVAGGTETHRAVDLSPVESLFVSLILMARLGDEVVAGQPLYCPTAQPAGFALRAAVRLAHSYDLTTASIEDEEPG